jgi:hypothetical protein
MQAIQAKMYLKYGKTCTPIDSPKHASDVWSAVRDEGMRNGCGMDEMRSVPWIVDDKGKRLGFVSWNGRVWHGTNYSGIGNAEWVE